ncbi:hypothetical protein ACVW1A_005281 [Bradyrhizobium sp. LB1.3]
MTERIHIRQRYREEFEQLGEVDLRKRLEAGMYDEEKRKHGWAWLDEKANGEERVYRARQLALQERNDRRSNISLVVSVVAVIIAGLALYRSWPQINPDTAARYAEALTQKI